MVITDGVFSMEGDVAPLDEILTMARKYRARVMLDDAHALGVIGPNGRGTAELFGVEGQGRRYHGRAEQVPGRHRRVRGRQRRH